MHAYNPAFLCPCACACAHCGKVQLKTLSRSIRFAFRRSFQPWQAAPEESGCSTPKRGDGDDDDSVHSVESRPTPKLTVARLQWVRTQNNAFWCVLWGLWEMRA